MTWRALAQCAVEGVPVEAMFPERYDPTAAAICERCPVRLECAAEDAQHGIWGGELRGYDVRACQECSRIIPNKGRHRSCGSCRKRRRRAAA